MCPFLRVKEERARWSSATGDDGFCSWPPSRITDEKGFGGPFLWRVSSKGPASMHEDASDLPLLLPSSALDSRDPGPLSSTYRFESCTPRRPPIPARPSFALWTRILLCLRFLFFFFLFPRWHYWVYDLVLRIFSPRTRCLTILEWLMYGQILALIFHGFLRLLVQSIFDWWIYYFFFFWEREGKKVNWIAVQVISIFTFVVCNFLIDEFDIFEKKTLIWSKLNW